MKINGSLAALAALFVLPAPARAQATFYQGGRQQSFRFAADSMFRQEWNQDEPAFQEASRWRLQLRPRLEFGVSRIGIGVGGEFNYSKDRNTKPPEGQTTLPLIRDNYKSRDARLDLAYLRLRPAAWMELQGGRFEMPVGVTEMIWDRDLRPQGGALTLSVHDSRGDARLGLTGLWARGSHVFEDGDATMLVASAEGVLSSTVRSRFSVTGSFVRLTKIDELAPQIRRQNTRVAGALVREYEVVDVVARLRSEGRVTSQIVADYCWNTAVDGDNKGLWLALVLGSTRTARARLEYVYARIDKDATLAAYNGDDFFWGTGWEGHRVDFGVKSSSSSSIHAIGEIARFKDSPNPAERDIKAKRLRIELRVE
jgi:hypothetical protein